MERQKDKILIVDDVELNRAILCELFAGDYEILEADNGKTAVDLMEQYHEEIAIVLMVDECSKPFIVRFCHGDAHNTNNWLGR